MVPQLDKGDGQAASGSAGTTVTEPLTRTTLDSSESSASSSDSESELESHLNPWPSEQRVVIFVAVLVYF